MSFDTNSIWMPRNDADTSSRTESKRDYQWLADASAPELFCSKKQGIDAANGRPISSGTSNARTLNLLGRSNIAIVGASNFGDDHQLGSASSAGLSMSHTMEDPLSSLNYGGIRTVNQARDAAENGMSILSKGGNNTISIGATFNKTDNNISLGPTFNKEDDKFISRGGHSFNKGVVNFRLMGHDINVGDNHKGDDSSSVSMDHMHEKGNGNTISANPAYNKWQEKFIPMDSGYEKVNENSMPISSSFDTRGKNVTQISDKKDKGKSWCFSAGQNYNNKGKSITLSSGNFQAEHNTAPNAGAAPATTFTTDVAPMDTEQTRIRKTASDNFPSNVKCLLSTGIFDGVPVKYFSWSREKNLKGIIKGNGYLCGCKDCKFSKAINAFEFERHAGCQTKHTNNHIYFQNGKTIYALVQELKRYPPELLLEAIPKATGSPINKKNFNIWKASYQAATHELKRIYAEDKPIIRS